MPYSGGKLGSVESRPLAPTASSDVLTKKKKHKSKTSESLKIR